MGGAVGNEIGKLPHILRSAGAVGNEIGKLLHILRSAGCSDADSRTEAYLPKAVGFC